MAALKLLFVLTLSSVDSIPEVPIHDKLVISVLNTFNDSIQNMNKHQAPFYHIHVRVDSSKYGVVIYVATGYSTGAFKFGIPDKYSLFGKQLVFWYENKDKEYDDDRFRKVSQQFNSYLINDLDSLGNFLFPINEVLMPYLDFKTDVFSFYIKKQKVVRVQRARLWPGRLFYMLGLQYDKRGRLMHEDGTYHPDSFDKWCRLKPFYSYELIEYKERNGVLYDCDFCGALITIGKNGKPIKIEIEDPKDELDELQEIRYREVLIKMPAWKIGRVAGRRVVYKVRHGI
jgi:hypothetical protein